MLKPDPDYVAAARMALDMNDQTSDSSAEFPDVFTSHEDWLESRVASLLCNIWHYCHATGLDYEMVEHLGYIYYLDSLGEEDD